MMQRFARAGAFWKRLLGILTLIAVVRLVSGIAFIGLHDDAGTLAVRAALILTFAVVVSILAGRLSVAARARG